MKESISIIIPAYKATKYLKECLDSINSQTYFIDNNLYEIIVGIDGCTETLDYLNTIRDDYKNLRVLFMEENKGPYITINTLLANTTYDVYTIFNADDIMYKDMIETHMETLKTCHVVSGNCAVFNDGDVDNISKISSGGDGVLSFKKTVLQTLGGFRPWRCAADTEFRQRIKKSFLHKHIRINHVDFLYRQHENSITHVKETDGNSIIRANYAKYIRENNNNPAIRIKPDVNKFKEI